MMVNAARHKDSGKRNDVAAGMAKYLASEFCRNTGRSVRRGVVHCVVDRRVRWPTL